MLDSIIYLCNIPKIMLAFIAKQNKKIISYKDQLILACSVICYTQLQVKPVLLIITSLSPPPKLLDPRPSSEVKLFIN